jgi:hypothetical protein
VDTGQFKYSTKYEIFGGKAVERNSNTPRMREEGHRWWRLILWGEEETKRQNQKNN